MAKEKKQNEELSVEEVLTQSETFIAKYKNAIIGVVALIIIGVCGLLAYQNFYSAPRETKAYAALFKGEMLFEQGQFEEALNGDSLGYTGFLNVADEFSGTKAANLAKAYAGICYANLDKNEEAIKQLEGFKGADQMVAPSVLAAIGNAYAKLNQLDKATSYLVQAADKADNNTLSPIFLVQAGNIYESQGKYADAVKVYTKVKEKYFQSYQSMDIDKYIERASLQK